MDFKPFKIGKYLLLERIATGGMAEVYRAKASGAGGFEKQLAIKRILPNYSQNEEFRRMFEYEARLSSMLNHANIVQVYDFVKSGETYLLAMEYVPGKNLRQFVNKAKKMGILPPLSFSAWIINEVCKGLEYAHQKKDDLTGKPLNIIHRDMSPQNVMLSYDGAVKIVDFGIAKAKDRVDETRSGVIKGKFGYMSPEQANGQPIDHRSDIFSTAIILFEMICGKRLFTAENDMATLKMIQECVIPSPTRLNPKIPAEFEKIVLKGLTKDLNLRYQNAGVFQRHLQSFLNKYFPSFTQKEASDIIQRVFRVEIEKENRRYEQLYRQSIPFSQGAKVEEDGHQEQQSGGLADPMDGEITRSEQIENTAVTSVDDRDVGDLEFEPSAASSAEATQVGESMGSIDETQIDSLIIEDESIPTLSKGNDSQSASIGTGGRTLVNDPLLDIPDSPSTSYPSRDSGITLRDPKSRGGGSISVVRPGSGRSEQATAASSRNSDLVVRNDYAPGTDSGELKEINERTMGSISLVDVALNNQQTGESEVRQRSEPPAFNPRTDYVPRKRKSRVFPMIMLLGTLLATVGLYNFYLEGSIPDFLDRGLPALLEKVGVRVPANNLQGQDPATQVSPPPVTNRVVVPKTYGDCTLQVGTDPVGATLFINGEERGITSTTTSVACDEGTNIEIRLEGYESVSENVVVPKSRDNLKSLYRTLRRIPTGELELILNRNADVYVDGKLVEEAVVNQPVVLKLRGNRKYQVRFINEVLGIDVTREFIVETDSVTRQNIILDDQ